MPFVMNVLPRSPLVNAEIVTAVALVLAASWAFVAWMTLDMSHPFVMMMMPIDASWSWATIGAVFMMWAIMMIAMMLPSAAPMILCSTLLSVAIPLLNASGSDHCISRAHISRSGLACLHLLPACNGGCSPMGC